MTNIEQSAFAEDMFSVYISGYHLLLCLELTLQPSASSLIHFDKKYTSAILSFQGIHSTSVLQQNSFKNPLLQRLSPSLQHGTKNFLRRSRFTWNVENPSGAVPAFGCDKIPHEMRSLLFFASSQW